MFITLEGIEGSGKTTLLQNLKAHFQTQGKKVLLTREPGGSALGQNLRSIVLNQDSKISSQAELFLFLADRAEHINAVIKPALDKGEVVLCDRYIDSTMAYQGFGRGLDLAMLGKLNYFATQGLLPKLTFLLDLEVEQGLTRARTRNKNEDLVQKEGRFEAEDINFHAKIRQGFLTLAKENSRIKILDASKIADEVAKDAFEIISKFSLN